MEDLNAKEWLDNDELAYKIWDKKYRNNGESFNAWLKRISNNDNLLENLIRQKKFIFGGRILASRGITDRKITYSNCYVITPPEDNLESIFDCAKKIAKTFSYGGGCGTDLSNLRPKGAAVHNAAKTTSGPVSFMELFSQTTETIGQEGRRGALMLSMDVRHPDIEDFIDVKTDLNKVNYANISVRVNNAFMKAVKNDEDYLLTWPCNQDLSYFSKDYLDCPYNTLVYLEDHKRRNEIFYIKKIRAKQLFEKIAKNNWNYAEPGILYWDRISEYNMLQGIDFEYAGVNPCFTGDMKLLTSDGYKTFNELCGRNDIEVVSYDGSISMSNKVWCSGEKEIVSIKFANGEIIKCTPNHKFMLNDGTTCEAKDLKGKRIKRYAVNSVKYDNKFIKFGFIQGDGGLGRLRSKHHLGIEVNIGKKDLDIMDLFSNDIIQSKSQRSFYICGYKDELHNLGFSVESLPKRTMPTSYNNWDKTEKLSFLRGMFSANGSVVKNHRIQYKSTCKKLILELQKALLDFEINTNITINKAHNNTFSNGTYLCKESYDLCINQLSSIIKFSELINFVHKYKQESLEELISTRSFMIISVTKIGKEKVFDFTENNNHWGMVNGCVVHNCAEEPLPAGGSCLLGSINLAEFVKNPFTKEAKVNYIGLISTVHKAVRALNDVLQEGKFLHPLEEQIEAVSKWKQIGLGTMGLADMLIKLGVEYGGIDSLMFIHNVYKTIAEAAVIESANIAGETKSPYEGFDFEAFKESNFINNLSLPKAVLSKIKRYGMYNSQLLTCAPTGSIATMLGVSTGIEPIYAMKYTRTTKSLEGKDNIFEIYTPIAKNYLQTHNNLPDYFVESKDISPSDRIRAQAQIQDFIDASISSTINLPKEATVEDIYNIYINAWEYNTKGVTVYRNGCAREGILNTEKIVKEVPNRQAPKRPKSIPAKVEVVKIKGELFAVFIGFYEDKPYEIFTSKVDEHFTPEEGVIIKKSKGLYAFESANYRNIALMQTSSFEEKAATLYTSMLLRHGVNIKYIIKTAKKVNNNITSFSSAMCRVLIKYQPKDDIKELCPNCGAELIKEGGCTHCSTCEWSKCMFIYNLKNKRNDKNINK